MSSFPAILPAGGHIVVEYINGKANVYDNTKVGVLTNDPPFPWHMDNIIAYSSLSPDRANQSAPFIGDVLQQRKSMGLSPGLDLNGLNTFGMPADGSSPSRFINVRLQDTFNSMMRYRTHSQSLPPSTALLYKSYIPLQCRCPSVSERSLRTRYGRH